MVFLSFENNVLSYQEIERKGSHCSVEREISHPDKYLKKRLELRLLPFWILSECFDFTIDISSHKEDNETELSTNSACDM